MTDPMSVLAMTGATTIVAAMATSTWESARGRVAELFRRRGEDEATAIAVQLDGDAHLVADEDDTEGVREELIRPWARRLAALLREHPEATEELRRVVEEVAAGLPRTEQHWTQNVTAHSGGTAFGTQGPGSSVHIHRHITPEEAASGDSAPGGGTSGDGSSV
ncbi:hypothetical protein GCM10011583_22400 [Streptomyces camponoticapitis]|uniref:Uncharacterized protein n=1 Tax=Streptomyces camponoticapitis TaxID=1616125 RepID=A0ABQ2E447_9ACTN|nr:hypothetical protein [Streptomyces camponoticapitis]GGJ90508.1 hypothetical protein GCM10011583_22400 [Streptomyces camponoticapitis]